MPGRPILLSLSAVLSLSVAACADPVAAPAAAGISPSASEVKFWDANATATWNQRATELSVGRTPNTWRLYTYLSLAQLRAAEDAQEIRPHPPTSSAIGAASAAVLAAFFPTETAHIEEWLDAQADAEPWPGAKHESFAAGEAIGRAAAARVLAWAAGDRVGLTNPGTPPTTPGSWVWTPGSPIARGLLGARPFFLASTDELRPAAPPAFGSAEYLDALAEVRHASQTRTAEQTEIVKYWHANQSANSSRATNELAVELIRAHRRGDAESARILFLMNAATFDATIGCFDAKYHYWFIRPAQADAQVALAVPMPAHPSYPSAHSCISGAAFGVLDAAFPGEHARIARMEEEASTSRLLAGLHYRFDLSAGLALGHAAAAKAMAADLDGVAVR